MRQPLLRMLIVLALLLLTGITGYLVIEGWSLLDSFYMTAITLTTVGYREVRELSQQGQIFTAVYLLVGLGTFFYEATQIGELIVKGELNNWLGRRRMDSALKSLRGHIVVCGFGRLGRRLCEELAARRKPFVVVDREVQAVAACRELGWPWVVGDATEDSTLLEAGIERASGLASVLPTDAENLYTVLSARLLGKDLRILTRATSDKDAEKLRKAGAHRVVNLYETGATKMAQVLANPNVDDFMEVLGAKGNALELAEVQVDPGSSFSGKPLAETDLRSRGIVVVGIRRQSGDLLLLPGGRDVPYPGDFLIALGRAEAIQDLIRGRLEPDVPGDAPDSPRARSA